MNAANSLDYTSSPLHLLSFPLVIPTIFVYIYIGYSDNNLDLGKASRWKIGKPYQVLVFNLELLVCQKLRIIQNYHRTVEFDLIHQYFVALKSSYTNSLTSIVARKLHLYVYNSVWMLLYSCLFSKIM